jgi:hypothetical protein
MGGRRRLASRAPWRPIGRLHQRDDAELLIDLEEDEPARLRLVAALRDAFNWRGTNVGGAVLLRGRRSVRPNFGWAYAERLMPGDELDRPDPWALADLESAVAVIQGVVGIAFGPIGVVLAALLGPQAKHAIAWLTELRSDIGATGLSEEELVDRLDSDPRLAQLVANIVRGTVESDSVARRKLLARSAVRALEDGAKVTEEAIFVRAANGIDAVDVRALVIVADPPPRSPTWPAYRVEGFVYLEELEARWSGEPTIVWVSTSRLEAQGLIERGGVGGGGYGSGPPHWRITPFGRFMLDRLIAEGLDAET